MTLEKYGVDTAMVARVPGVPTSATILNVRPNGERPAMHVREASDHFDVAPAELRHRLRMETGTFSGVDRICGACLAPAVQPPRLPAPRPTQGIEMHQVRPRPARRPNVRC